MTPKKKKDIVDELIEAIPLIYNEPHTQIVYQYGYLIGLLSYICRDDFYARAIVENKIEELKGKKR